MIFNAIYFCSSSSFCLSFFLIHYVLIYTSHSYHPPTLTPSLTPSLPHSLIPSLPHLLTYSLTFTHSHLLTLSLSLTHFYSLPPSLTLLRRRGTWYSARGRIYALTFLDLTHTILFDVCFIPKYYLIHHNFTLHILKSIYLYLHIFILPVVPHKAVAEVSKIGSL